MYNFQGDAIYSIENKKYDNSIATAQAAFKSVLGNPVSRALLKSSLRPYEIGNKTFPARYWALGAYAGEEFDGDLPLLFQSQTVKPRPSRRS